MDTLLEHLTNISKDNPMTFYLGLTHCDENEQTKFKIDILKSPSTSDNVVELIKKGLPLSLSEKISFEDLDSFKGIKLLYTDLEVL